MMKLKQTPDIFVAATQNKFGNETVTFTINTHSFMAHLENKNHF